MSVVYHLWTRCLATVLVVGLLWPATVAAFKPVPSTTVDHGRLMAQYREAIQAYRQMAEAYQRYPGNYAVIIVRYSAYMVALGRYEQTLALYLQQRHQREQPPQRPWPQPDPQPDPQPQPQPAPNLFNKRVEIKEENLYQAAVMPRPIALGEINGTRYSKTVTLRPQQQLTLTLPTNASTGYAWSTQISQSGVVAIESKAVAPSTGRLVGAGSQVALTITGRQAGTTTVTFSYTKPYETGAGQSRTVVLTITVASPAATSGRYLAVETSPSSQPVMYVVTDETAHIVAPYVNRVVALRGYYDRGSSSGPGQVQAISVSASAQPGTADPSTTNDGLPSYGDIIYDY